VEVFNRNKFSHQYMLAIIISGSKGMYVIVEEFKRVKRLKG